MQLQPQLQFVATAESTARARDGAGKDEENDEEGAMEVQWKSMEAKMEKATLFCFSSSLVFLCDFERNKFAESKLQVKT